MRPVMPLSEVDLVDAPLVGAKAATLGALLAAGFPIPPGVCITTDAFRLALAPWQADIDRVLAAHDLHDPAIAHAAANHITTLLSNLTLPDALISALAGTHFTYPASSPLSSQSSIPNPQSSIPLAVRSSATAEDQPDQSFAGQYISLLGVCGEAALHQAIPTVWRSFFSANALAARAQVPHPPSPSAPLSPPNLGGTAPSGSPSLYLGEGDGGWGQGIAVLIQPMLDAECAGVCFSVDPVAQRGDGLVINTAWGLGAGVADGAVATDTYWLRRSDLSVAESRVVEKPMQIICHPDGGTQTAAVEAKRRRAACLPDAWAQRIAQFAMTAEALLGYRVDLEWAIANGQVWVLQCRPITALPKDLAQPTPFPFAWDTAGEARYAWHLRRAAGRDLMLPLEIDVLRVWESAGDEGRRAAGHPFFYRGKYVNGRVYFANIPSPVPAGDRRVRVAALDDLRQRLTEQDITAWEHIGPEMERATARLAQFRPDQADNEQLAAHLEDAIGVYRRHWSWHGPLMHAAREPYFAAYAALTGRPRDAIVEAAGHLTVGYPTPLTRLMDAIYEMAVATRQSPAVARLVAAPPSYVMDQFASLPEAEALVAQLSQFLAEFGERNGDGYGSEVTICTPTWRETPDEVLRLVAAWLDPTLEAPSAVRARVQAERDAEVDQLCAACPDSDVVAEFRHRLAFAQRDAAFIEQHNHTIDQLSLGQLRHAALYAAERLVAQGALTEVDDVFWLTLDEILVALRAPTPSALDDLVTHRQTEYARCGTLVAPLILGLPNAQLSPRPPLTEAVTAASKSTNGVLRGQGASAGCRRGRARVVPAEADLPSLIPGDILVAENAGPLWTPFFPILGGLVLDEGSFGQHAATTAREYGIPAVIAVGDATRRISDGAWVTIDGTLGEVRLEDAG